MTDRLFLRPFHENDGMPFYENVMRDIGTPGIFDLSDISPEAARLYVRQREQYSLRPRFYDYAVIRCSDNMILGEINAAFIPPDTADVGYVIGRRFRGNGYAAEALNLLLKKLSEDGIKTVYGACMPDNPASEAVMRSCGMGEAEFIPGNVRKRESETGLKWFVKRNR